MSRIGKKPIVLPEGVSCEIRDRRIVVKGPKGELTVALPPKVNAAKNENELTFTILNSDDPRQEAFWGLGRSLVYNAVVGVTQGFSKQLELSGIGFRASLRDNNLVLAVGFSHPVEFMAPDGIILSADGNTVTVSGIDKQLVGEAAARIRAIRPVEPYKGKGIKYVGEVVRRKAGKVAKGVTA